MAWYYLFNLFYLFDELTFILCYWNWVDSNSGCTAYQAKGISILPRDHDSNLTNLHLLLIAFNNFNVCPCFTDYSSAPSGPISINETISEFGWPADYTHKNVWHDQLLFSFLFILFYLILIFFTIKINYFVKFLNTF